MPFWTDIRAKVDRLVDDALAGTDFFRVETTVKGTARTPVISVYLDGDSGINIDDCAKISRDLQGRIENAGITGDGFELNVSSPGLERSLRLPRQYARHVGRVVRFELSSSEAKSSIEGRLLGAGDTEVRIEVDAAEVVLPLASIRKAAVKAAW